MPSADRTVRSRALPWVAVWSLALWSAASLGCATLWRSADDSASQTQALDELMKAPEPPELIRMATAPHGVRPLDVEGVGVVNGLPGTGGPPDPSRLRDELLDEIKRHNVANPNQLLEASNTALVRVRATVPPGAKRGDAVDIRLLAPRISRASDLHGGWLLDTWLRQQQRLGGVVRKSDLVAVATGEVLTRADYAPGADDSLKLEGNIIGGGRVQETRKLGLVIQPGFQHAKVAAWIAAAINHRFFFFDGSSRRGVAKATEDDFIELELHPRYRNHVIRYMRVVGAIGGRPEETAGQQKLAQLGELLADPDTAAEAAIQLEAIGENAVPTLLDGLTSADEQVRWHAAQTLAYLDRAEAIPILERAIAESPATRREALIALEGLREPTVIDAYRRLLDSPSLEARYGAFCSLRRRNDGKRTLSASPLNSFTVYTVPSAAPATVVVSLREAPEIVLFGELTPLRLQTSIIGPAGLVVTTQSPESSPEAETLKISRFEPGKKDRRTLVDNTIAGLAKGITEVGGGYGDVIAVLREIKSRGELPEQLAIDPIGE